MHRDGLQVTPENLTVLAPHRALLLPHGSSVCRHRAPCKPSSVIGTSVSLRRIDRACYQDRCDVHSDTSDDTYSLTRRAAKRSRQEPHKATRAASRSSDRRARSMSESQGQARRAATQSGATSRASACAGAPQPTVQRASRTDPANPPPGLTGHSSRTV